MMMCISLESLEKSTGRSSEGTKEKVRTQNGLLSALLSNNAQNLPPVLTSSDYNSHDIKLTARLNKGAFTLRYPSWVLEFIFS